MQLFFHSGAVFLVTSLAALFLYYFLRLCLRRAVQIQHSNSRSETRLYRPKTGHIYSFCLLGSATVVVAAYLFLGNPTYGIPLIPLVCVLSLPVFSMQQEAKHFRNERATINFLHGLHGLIQGGLSLPSALVHLADAEFGEVSVALQGRLKGIAKGESVASVLEESRRLLGLDRLSACLAALEVAYEKGLSIGPILAASLPSLESEADMVQRIRELRKSIATQATLACVLPWAIVALMRYVSPDVAPFLITPWTAIWIAGGIAWYGLGVYSLWQISEFY